MSESGDDRDRQLVPRWRSFVSASDFGEVQPLTTLSTDTLSAKLLDEVLHDWKHEPSLSVAADVVSSAVAIGQLEPAHDAARFVLQHDNAPATAHEIARRCLGDLATSPSEFFIDSYRQPSFSNLSLSIRRARLRLSDYPFNPILWTNLALLYTTAGQPQKAERAILAALGLAPDNRFVVRAACRLFLHQSDSERAHDVLLRSTTMQGDPWLASAEIAVATVRHRSSRFIKSARKMAESQNFSPFHLSELNGALATLEAGAGGLKKASRLFEKSLDEPAENAIAQAAWVGRNIDSKTLEPLNAVSKQSSEASAWMARSSGHWEEAFVHAKQWQNEQPFSSRPALFASHAASTGLEDFQAAEDVLQQGLRCNPDDVSLLNNRAFALAKQGKTADARETLDQAVGLMASDESRICLKATEGLVEFRSGNVERGQLLYRQAIDSANTPNLEPLARIATIYLALEELHAATPKAQQRLAEATEAAKSLRSPYRETFLDKLKRAKAPAV